MAEPWDPSLVKVDSRVVTVDALYRRLEAGEINLQPNFQRNQNLWGDRERSWFIESLLLGIPIPTFYFDISNDDSWVVIDGLQRLSTLKAFFFGNFELVQMQYLKELEGLSFTNLPRSLSRRILETQFNINAVLPGAPEMVVFDIFRRINTGGLMLNSQEIRNALNQGLAIDLLDELTLILLGSNILGEAFKGERGQAEELSNRFLAFTILGYKNYNTNDMDVYLNDSLVYVNNMELYPQWIVERFERALYSIGYIFEDKAFRKVAPSGKRRRINKALFEIWTTIMGAKDSHEIDILMKNRDDLRIIFFRFLNTDIRFNSSISSGTSEVSRVFERFSSLDDFLNRFIKERQ